MQLTDLMTNSLTGKKVQVGAMIDSANKTAYQAKQLAAAAARDAAANLALTKAIAAKQLTPAQIAAAVKAGVDAANADNVIITGDVTVTPKEG
jgi:3',5'-cyclic AMP phosphodiesterase CpdA